MENPSARQTRFKLINPDRDFAQPFTVDLNGPSIRNWGILFDVRLTNHHRVPSFCIRVIIPSTASGPNRDLQRFLVNKRSWIYGCRRTMRCFTPCPNVPKICRDMRHSPTIDPKEEKFRGMRIKFALLFFNGE